MGKPGFLWDQGLFALQVAIQWVTKPIVVGLVTQWISGERKNINVGGGV